MIRYRALTDKWKLELENGRNEKNEDDETVRLVLYKKL